MIMMGIVICELDNILQSAIVNMVGIGVHKGSYKNQILKRVKFASYNRRREHVLSFLSLERRVLWPKTIFRRS